MKRRKPFTGIWRALFLFTLTISMLGIADLAYAEEGETNQSSEAPPAESEGVESGEVKNNDASNVNNLKSIIEANKNVTLSNDYEDTADYFEINKSREKIDRDPTNGALIFSYDINLPPGRNDIEPSLDLKYNSNKFSKITETGYGWELDIPYINRINYKGLDNMYNNEHFYSSISGELKYAYADNNIKVYRPEVEDGNFLQYEYVDNSYWRVIDKMGAVYTFGETMASRQDDPNDSTRIYKWMLEEFRDTNDNFYRYEYYKESGQIYPKDIYYTGNANVDGNFKVSINLEERDDDIKLYDTNFEVYTQKRIDNIYVYINNILVNEYDFSYRQAVDNNRSLLISIQEIFYDEQGAQTSRPPTIFDYTLNSNLGWERRDDLIFLNHDTYDSFGLGLNFMNVDGDAFPDLVYYYNGGQDTIRSCSNNNGEIDCNSSNVHEDTENVYDFIRPYPYYVDVDGDYFTDVINIDDDIYDIDDDRTMINNHDYTWSTTTNYAPDYSRIAQTVDMNGDGLVDLASFLSSCGGTNGYALRHNEDQNFYWAPCFPGLNGILLDMNGDGLPDDISTFVTYDPHYDTYIPIRTNIGEQIFNFGGWASPLFAEYPEFLDINGDGLKDMIGVCKNNPSRECAYYNTGKDWVEAFDTNVVRGYMESYPTTYDGNPFHSGETYHPYIIDINGDGLDDFLILKTRFVFAVGQVYDHATILLNKGESKNGLLNYINSSSGKVTNITYNPSTKYNNPKVPFVLHVVSNIFTDDGLGNISTTTYNYENGDYYYDNPYKRKFAGFGKVETETEDKTITTYYHQGNNSSSTLGEYNDSYYKIGKPYRTEVYDDTDTLIQQELHKWDEYDLGNDAKYVFDVQKSVTDFTDTQKSVASQYLYDMGSGNLLTENNLGEVTINTDTGEIANILTGDEKDVDYQYATNTAKHILSAPKKKTISDSTNSKEQDLYYDNLAHGSVDKVNLTKEDYLVDDVEVNRIFNNYGLVETQIDPEGATTTISYDTNNMYPSITTDPLGHQILTDYNLLNGQPATTTEANGRHTVNKYDGFGRLLETKVSDPDDPNSFVTAREITYFDSVSPKYTESKDYFTSTDYVTSREYYDGLDRVIQQKTETDTAGQYATVDISYDEEGRVDRKSLPYITNSLDYSAPNLSKPSISYTYDSLDRIKTETTPVGTTSYTYDGFKTTITDPNNIQKDLIKDAHGNLVEVIEHNGSETYTTNYEYSLTNKLEKIIDSAGNIRNFHYDDLDNLDWQDIVHKPSVTSPAQIDYTHDKNGNVKTENSFKGDAISYDYDAINRVEYEKLSSNNEINYVYDQNDDTGMLTFTDYGEGNSKAYDYDVLGRVTTVTTTIENEDFVMHYDYNLNGDIKEIVYPNDWVLSYNFNNIGQVETMLLDRGSGADVLVDNITYNQNGQMTHMERDNGVITDYLYDPQQNFRLVGTTSTIATTTLQALHYTYDDVGNITVITDNSDTDMAKTASHYYDDLNRLTTTSVSYTTHSGDSYTQEFSYDEIGNMTYNSYLGTMDYLNDNPHQLSGYATRTFAYDDAGNQKYNGGLNKFGWDHRNRLKSTYDIPTENKTYYKYDHNNQRMLKYTEDYVFVPPDINFEETPIEGAGFIEMAVGGSGAGYWEWRRIAEDKYIEGYFEKDLNDNTKTHIFLNGTKIVTINNNDDPYFILSDHLGSSNILIGTSGVIAETADYLPYGEINYENVVTDMDDDYDFTGQEYDEENSLQYYGARYLDNQVGRFTSIDPLLLRLDKNEIYNKLYKGQYVDDHKFNNLLLNLKADKKVITENGLKKESYYYFLSDPQQLNSYAYVTNNPVIGVDNNGEWEVHFTFSTNIGIGVEGGNAYKFGIASDGTYGSSIGYNVGALAGADASINIGLGHSDADTWSDVDKGKYNVKLGGHYGIGGDFNAVLDENKEEIGHDINIGAGFSSPMYFGVGKGEEYVTTKGNIKEDFNNFINNTKQNIKNTFSSIKDKFNKK